MRKKFLTNIFLLITVNLLVKPFWILGVDREVQNAVGNAEFGMYASLFAFSLLFLVLLDFGINNYTGSAIAKDHSIIGVQFSSLVPLKLFFSLGYVVITLLSGIMYGLNNRELWLLTFLCFNQVLAFFILYFRSNVSGLQLFKTDAALSVVDRTLMIMICSLFIWFSVAEVTIENFVYAQSVAYACSVLICFLALRPHLPALHLNFNREVLYTLLKSTYPYALLAFLIALYTRIDLVLIKKLFPDGDQENGIYAQANRLLEAANMLTAMVASMLLPLFSKLLKQKQELQLMVRTVTSVILAPAVMLSVFCCVYRAEIMNLLYVNSSDYTAQVFGITILGFIPTCLMYIFGTLLTAHGNLSILNKMATIALAVNLGLNLLLIPSRGALGAATAAVITQLVFGGANVVYARKGQLADVAWSTIVRYILFAGAFAIVVMQLQTHIQSVWRASVISLLAGALLVFALRIFNYRSVLHLVTKTLRGD